MYGSDSYALGAALSSPYVTVKNVIWRIRRNLREFDPEYFSDEQLLSWVNEAHQELYNEVCLLYENYFKKTTTLDLVKDVAEYALPNDFKRVVFVEKLKDLDTTLTVPIKLRRVPFQQLNQSYRTYYPFLTLIGYYIHGTTIGFVPTPKTNSTQAVRVHYIPTPNLLTLDSNHQLPAEYSRVLVLLATYLAISAEDQALGQQFYSWYERSLALMRHEMANRDDSYSKPLRGDFFNEDFVEEF